MTQLHTARPDGIAGSTFPGPFPVGTYAVQLRERLRLFARVQLVGELWGLRTGGVRVYFELRDTTGALPCSMWRDDFEALGLRLTEGVRIVVGGGCDFYPGSASASPGFTFAVTEMRIEGEGDLLAQLERLRRRLHEDGLFEPQKRLRRRELPRVIGVVTGEQGKARDDVLAGLHRRGWGGTLVWAFAPVQDRRAAPAIAASLRELAARPEVDVVIVARGGGSLADLFAFCDETLCRTVALLQVPVISSVGHHTDRTLIDDVAAVACSTPTHAAEVAVPIDCRTARRDLRRTAAQLDAHARRAVITRARMLSALSRAPARHIERHRSRLHQLLRELRASARRARDGGRAQAASDLHTLARRSQALQSELHRDRPALRLRAGALERAAETSVHRRRRDLEQLVLALSAHDPQRTLERGYALVYDDRSNALVHAAGAARDAGRLRVRFVDGSVVTRVETETGAP